MKVNRWKNIWTYIGMIAIVLTATHIEPADLTSWTILWGKILEVLKNPFLLGTVILALLGNYVNPTTGGLKD